MQGRFCGENIRLISDIIDFCSFNKKPGLILLVDFEKAFDTVNLSFLKKSVTKYGFGKNFQKWNSILYNNIVSCVTNNGYQSQYFQLTRGIRQGCPLSALLFLLIAEVIANTLRSCENVRGIKVKKTEIKLCQFADDMTLFVSDMQSVEKALALFEEFHQYAGLKLNKSKTEAIIIYNDGNLIKDTNLGIKWLSESFSTLGTTFFLNASKTISSLVDSKLSKIKKVLNLWQPRSLTVKGRITIVKTLIVPHVLLLASVVPLDHSTFKDLDKLLFDFIWKNGLHLISKENIIQPIENGGLKMVKTYDIVNAAKIMWIKRLKTNRKAKWTTLAEVLMGIELEQLEQKLSLESLHISPESLFYKDLAKVWFKFIGYKPKNFQEFLQQPIFFNNFFTIGKKYISTGFRQWFDNGIHRVSDILNQNSTFQGKDSLENKFNIEINNLQYNQIRSSVAFSLKSISNKESVSKINVPDLCLTNFKKVSSKIVLQYLTEQQYATSKSQNKWVEYYPFLEKVDWKLIYILPTRILLDTYIITLQFKILHRVFNCNYKLYIWNKIDSPTCHYCRSIDNLEHYFFHCNESTFFWNHVEEWLKDSIGFKIKFTLLEILLGFYYIDKKYYYMLNYLIIYGKYYIFQCRSNRKNPSLRIFLLLVKDRLSLHKYIYIYQRVKVYSLMKGLVFC